MLSLKEILSDPKAWLWACEDVAEFYRVVTGNPSPLPETALSPYYLDGSKTLPCYRYTGIDTETYPDMATPLYVQASTNWRGTVVSKFVKVKDRAVLGDWWGRQFSWGFDPTRYVFHNARFDLDVLDKLGLYVPMDQVEDTMIAAYHLGLQQKLKVLASRLCGIEIPDYADLVQGATVKKAEAVLSEISLTAWDPEPPEHVWSKEPQEVWEYEEERIPCTSRKKGSIPCESCNPFGTFCKPPQDSNSDCSTCQGRFFYWLKKKRSGKKIIPGTENGYWREKKVRNAADVANSALERSPDKYFKVWKQLAERPQIRKAFGPAEMACLEDIPFDEARRYACLDSSATVSLWEILEPRLRATYGAWDAYRLDMATLPVIQDMERTGLRVDVDGLENLHEYFVRRKEEVEDAIFDLLGEEVDLGSSAQVATLLYDRLGLTPNSRTGGGQGSTDSKNLMAIATKHPVIKLILEWRGIEKNDGTYAVGIQDKERGGRIYPHLSFTRIPTGRFACSKPNLMAIPGRTEEGKRIKRCFLPDPGCKLVAGDYSQIEMRIAAHASRDSEMVRIFQDGEDMHTATAQLIFGISDPDLIDKDQHRKPSKIVNFGVLYGMGAKSLHNTLVAAGCDGWTEDKAEALIKRWFETFSGIANYFERRRQEARNYGYVTDCFKRRYMIPWAQSTNKWKIGEGLRKACNYVIQGAAQTVMKRGMVEMREVYEGFRKRGFVADPLIQIHDDMLFQVSTGAVGEFRGAFKETMEGATELLVPVVTETEVGDNWADMGKGGE
jgi:DNA polymerase I-like protein with 3'-5' exonuclease and polymerase domains